MFTGLSAFPLTPLDEHRIDEPALGRLVERAGAAGVDSLGVLGSTGSYAYLTRDERRRVLELAIAHAGGTPVLAGIGALRTRDVLALAADAQEAGADAVLLAPVSYQPLTPDEVYGLYEDATAELSVPLVVYDNPTTTRFLFTDELHAAIARLPRVASVKIPPVSTDQSAAGERIAHLRALLPPETTIGISGDACAATALTNGADAWYSVLAGVLPEICVELTRAAVGSGEAVGRAGLHQRTTPAAPSHSRPASRRSGPCSRSTEACGSRRPRPRSSASPRPRVSPSPCVR